MGWTISPPTSLTRSILLAISSVSLAAANFGTSVSVFKSRPDIIAPTLTIDTSIGQYNNVSPGYIFVTPNWVDQNAPYIYDSKGNLVWSGYNVSGTTEPAHSLRLLQYKGAPHLTFWQDRVGQGEEKAAAFILQDNYRPVKRFQYNNPDPLIAIQGLRIHTNDKDRDTTLVTFQEAFQHEYVVPCAFSEQLWMFAGYFQEFDLQTGEKLFEWSSLDHVDPSMSTNPLGSSDEVGNGLTREDAWDYFHIDSVDKTPDGDYIISALNTNTIYCISHVDGSIVWQLGGKESTFALKGFHFSSQHDARWLSMADGKITISFFNNAFDGIANSSTASSGMVVELDHAAHTARLKTQFLAPGQGFLSTSHGNVQRLDNGNFLVGWGATQYISEHDPNGTCIFRSQLGDQYTSNHVAYKGPWRGLPDDRPRLVASAASPNGTTEYHVSWNGATDVVAYQIHYLKNKDDVVYELTKTFHPTGFETSNTIPIVAAASFVMAMDLRGEILGRSDEVQTTISSGTTPPLRRRRRGTSRP